MNSFPRLILAILCITAVSHGSAQVLTFDSVYSARFQVQGHLSMGIPIGEFGEQMDRNGLGGGAEALFRLQGPAWIGLGGSAHRYDYDRITYFEFFDDERYEVEELTATRTAAAHLLFRFQPAHGRVFTPYFQAAIGWHWYFTNTKLKDAEFEEVFDQWNEDFDSRFGYGLSAGAMLTWPAVPEMGIDIRVGYFGNAAVRYLAYDPDSATGISGYPIDSFVTRETVVDLINVQIGFFYRM